MAEEKEIGYVIDYFSRVGVAAIKITNDSIKIGDTLHFKGNTTDFEQLVESMQIDRVDVNEAGVGKDVGIKVNEKVRKKDKVYKVEK